MTRTNINDLLAAAQARLDRLARAQAAERMRDRWTPVDARTDGQSARYGWIPHAVPVQLAGGSGDPREPAEATAIRETREEAGADIGIERLTGVYWARQTPTACTTSYSAPASRPARRRRR